MATLPEINRANRKRGKMPRTRLNRVGTTLLWMALGTNCEWAKVTGPRTLEVRTADCARATRLRSDLVRRYFRQLEDMGVVEEVQLTHGSLKVVFKDTANMRALVEASYVARA